MVKLPEEEGHQPLKKGEETPLQKGESLKKDEDAASLDSSGIPNMFLTPEKQEEKHPKASSASHAKSFMMRREGSLQKEKGTHALQKALGYGSKPCKRPASLEKGKALAKGNGHTKVEGTLAKGKGQPQGVAKSLGKGKKALEKGKKALEKGKKALEYICDEIMKSLQKGKIGKEEALQMRQVLVNNFP